MNFRVAVLQHSSSNNRHENFNNILTWMKEASKNNADIVLLPECFITGYQLPIENKDALTDDDSIINRICEEARKQNIGIIATALTRGLTKPQNSAFVIDKDGVILMKYSKVHTCDFADEACLESGNEFKVCDYNGIKLGVMICYDREYPESARVLMMKGAEIILIPNDCESMRPRIQALSTRAYENMLGIAMANRNGENAGNSCAYSPICWDSDGKCVDNTLLLASENDEGLFYVDFNMNEIRKYREHEMMGNTFRKPKAYSELMNRDIAYPFVRKGQ